MERAIVPERWERIIELVREQGSASVEKIAETLGISPATARRDLIRIEKLGLVKRTWGGAAPAELPRLGLTLAESRKVNPAEKELIGATAARLVEPGDTLLMDGGFTTYQVARHIKASNTTIATNSFDIANLLIQRENVALVMIGGEGMLSTGSTVGLLTEGHISRLSADKAILGADALSPDKGLSSAVSATAQIKMAMIRSAREIIVVADHSKLGRSALYRVSPIETISTLVTDDKADDEVLSRFRDNGVDVIVATSNPNSQADLGS